MLCINQGSPKAAKLCRIGSLNLDRRKVCFHAHAPQYPHARDVLHGYEEHVLTGEEAAHWGLIKHHKQPSRSILQHI